MKIIRLSDYNSFAPIGQKAALKIIKSSKNDRFDKIIMLGPSTEPRVPTYISTIEPKYYPQGRIQSAEFDRRADFIDQIFLC